MDDWLGFAEQGCGDCSVLLQDTLKGSARLLVGSNRVCIPEGVGYTLSGCCRMNMQSALPRVAGYITTHTGSTERGLMHE